MKTSAATLAALSCLGVLLCPIECRNSTARSDAPNASSHEPGRPLPAPSAPRVAARFAPLEGSWLEELDVGAGRRAVVTPPIGSTEPRPVVIAVHGGGDRPEWACGGWRLASHAFPFVLCPGGTPLGNGNYAWASSRAMADAIDASVQALRSRYGDRVSPVPFVYAGFSQGATLATAAVFARQRYRAVIFAEGGYDLVTRRDFAESLRGRGVRAVMFVCGGAACFARAARAGGVFDRAGLATLTAGDPLAGHNLNERMQNALQRSWPEFVAHLDGWNGYR